MSEVVKIDDIELPEGWQMAELAELAINPKDDIVDGPFGSNLKASEYTETGVPIIRLQNIKRNYFLDKNIKCVTPVKAEQLSRHSFKPGDLLITKLGAPLGVACIAPHSIGEGIIVADLVRARLPEDQVDTKYITYLINSPAVIQEFKENTKGTTRPRVNLKFMRSLRLPIAPYEQQKRIVAKIEELFSHIDAGIEALKKAKQLLKQYRQSVLKAAVTGELTKEWREANKDKLEPASQLLERILKERRKKWEEQQLEQLKAKGKTPKDDKWKEKYKELPPLLGEELEGLPDLPEGWAYTRLGNVIDEPKYGTSKKCTYDNNGIGVLRIPNVVNGLIDPEDLKYALFEDNEIVTYRLIAGDILTIRSNGSVNLVGKCALVGDGDTDYLYAGYLIRLRPNNVLASSSYLINCLNSIYLRKQIESKAKSTSGVNNINSGELQSLIIPIGSIDEQNEVVRLVVEKIESLDRLVGEIDIQLIKSEKSKHS
ncbi:MAG: hypothetical protein FHK82_17900, partial [Sedimenticola thiotaurini]